MEHPSIVERNSALPQVGSAAPAASTTLPATSSVSARIAAVTAHPPKSKSSEPSLRFPGEDGGQSLAEMACDDLDAALQLLAERAQYITGAGGAAIALRRGEHKDMLCRASSGSNAPELGALLSMEHGLSGESVRTRQALRCDDAERDPRVNREGCRRLGIASVMVMPILSEEQALGVFELFSGTPNAFDERDVSALQRLSEMIEIAVKYAAAAQLTTLPLQVATADSLSSADVVAAARIQPVAGVIAPVPPSTRATNPSPAQRIEKTIPEKNADEGLKKPLFWSSAIRTLDSPSSIDAAASTGVPPMLRNLRKCQACGFPVSQGRTFCVECEEKQWRGQTLPQPSPTAGRQDPPLPEVPARKGISRGVSAVDDSSSAQALPQIDATPRTGLAPPEVPAGDTEIQDSISTAIGPANLPTSTSPNIPMDSLQNVAETILGDVPSSDNEPPFLSSALESKSWLAANKYILGALLVMAIVIGMIVSLR